MKKVLTKIVGIVLLLICMSYGICFADAVVDPTFLPVPSSNQTTFVEREPVETVFQRIILPMILAGILVLIIVLIAIAVLKRKNKKEFNEK